MLCVEQLKFRLIIGLVKGNTAVTETKHHNILGLYWLNKWMAHMLYLVSSSKKTENDPAVEEGMLLFDHEICAP